MKNPMFIIDTGDTRMFYTLRYIKDKNYRAFSLDSFSGNESVVYCFSPAKRFTNDELLSLNNDSILLCGSLPLQYISLLESKNIRHCNLLLDEVFAIENSIQTAEASLMLIIRATSKSIFRMRHAILGYGRLGRALAKLFSSLGLDFAILTNDYYERASAHIHNCDVYDLSASLSDFDVIVNTIPAKVLSLDKLKSAKKCCYILDLASFSGVDSNDINSIGIAYDNALGLPGKYSPYSAGEILGDAILKQMEVFP